MKISYRTHPILKKVNEGRLSVISFYGEDRNMLKPENRWLLMEMKEKFLANIDAFRKNIKIITNPFYDAIELAKPKMITDELFYLDEPESGVLCMPNGVSYLYCLSPFNHLLKTYGDYFIICFKDDILLSYDRYHAGSKIAFISFNLLTVNRKVFNEVGMSDKNSQLNQIASSISTEIMATLNFIKYCPLEISHLAGNSRKKDISCKYINDTDMQVEILDSKWFTTLVKSDSFKVRGHFRFQPKKKGGEWTKELIWINDFEKTGYTASARKLNQPI